MTVDKKAEKILLDMGDDHKGLLLDILRANIPQLEVWAFGSRAKWTARETSDLDLVLRNPSHPESPIDLETIGGLKEIFDESDLPFMVDILDWATVSEKFRQVIAREYVVVQTPGKKGWKKTTLDEIAEIIMGQSPSGENWNETGDGVPLLNGPAELGSYHPTPVQFTTGPKKMAEIGDILLCIQGSTTGKMNWADQRYAIGRGLAAIRHKNGKDFQPFLKGIIEYYLPNLVAEATEPGFPNVSSPQLHKLEIDIPESLETQARIAAILAALDDKIELNHQTNVTLEAIAQAIVKEWLVDFHFPGAEPFFLKIAANLNESTVLAQIRDSLLPKLMNGEIEV
jgi:predicted nucleotidyltransferase